jgi:hypothetical protein
VGSLGRVGVGGGRREGGEREVKATKVSGGARTRECRSYSSASRTELFFPGEYISARQEHVREPFIRYLRIGSPLASRLEFSMRHPRAPRQQPQALEPVLVTPPFPIYPLSTRRNPMTEASPCLRYNIPGLLVASSRQPRRHIRKSNSYCSLIRARGPFLFLPFLPPPPRSFKPQSAHPRTDHSPEPSTPSSKSSLFF